MKFVTTQTRLAAAFVAMAMLLGATNAQAGGNGWGWAKPLNKKVGAFYTSNRNANFNRSRSRSSYGHQVKRYHTVVPQQHVQVVPQVTPPIVHHTTVVPASKTVVVAPAPTVSTPVVAGKPVVTKLAKPVAVETISSPSDLVVSPMQAINQAVQAAPQATTKPASTVQEVAPNFWGITTAK